MGEPECRSSRENRPRGDARTSSRADRPAASEERTGVAIEPSSPALSAALEQQIIDSLSLVPFIARRYRGCGLELDELVGAGNLGLVEAALRFDPSRGVKFNSYAVWWVRKTILSALAETTGALRLPTHQLDRLRSLRDVRAEWIAAFGREPDREQLGALARLTPVQVDLLLRMGCGSISLEDRGGRARGRSLAELLPDHAAANPQRSLIRRDLARHLHRHLTRLTAKERRVVARRFGLETDRPLTLRETAQRLGISRERVRQIEIRALLKLRRSFASRAGG